jgi:hypothetical protein
MWPLLSLGARYFHADLSKAAATAAGTYSVYDPGGLPVLITRVRVATDTAQRVVVGTADADGQRIVAGYLPSNSGILVDCELLTQDTAMLRKTLVVISAAASGLEVAIEGYTLPRRLGELLARGELPVPAPTEGGGG